MYNKIKTKTKTGMPLKVYHHVSLGESVLRDCKIWKVFLKQVDRYPLQLCRPFIDVQKQEVAKTLNFYSDASLSERLGFGAVFNNFWIIGAWGSEFIRTQKPSIEFLELFALVAAVLTWSNDPELQNTRVKIFCDNQSVMHIVNNLTSKCEHCMKLVRMLTIDNLKHNRRVFVEFVRTKDKVLADALSRFEARRFWKHAPKTMNTKSHKIHSSLWPVEKVWFGETEN